MQEFDFAVVGAGSGLDVANAVANQGQSVAVVEKGPLGGTCLNRGCIPSKMLLYHADVLETIERADEFGIDATVEDVSFAEIVREVNEDVGESAAGIRRGLESADQHELFDGEARFVGERTLELVDGPDEGAELRADTVLVAAGTRPSIPPIDGIEDVEYLTSRGALELESPPDHLVIVGGGYVAAELSHFFGTFGSDVSIVGRREHLLPQADEAVAAEFTERYEERFDLYTGYEATAVAERDGEIAVEAAPYDPDEEEDDADDGNGDGAGDGEAGDAGDGEADDAGDADGADDDPITVTGDELLVATGRRPNTDRLNVEAAGIETDDDGFVETDEYLRTSAEGVWALGDVVGEYLLKHNANHEARTVARNIVRDELEPVDYTAMPFAVFASPEVAGVGETESDLRDREAEYVVATQRYEDTARGSAMKVEGQVRVLASPDGEIEGCHVVGPDASSLIEEVVVAMKSGSGEVSDVQDSVHVHPALSEVVDRAFAGPFEHPGHEHGHTHEHERGQGSEQVD